MGNDANEYEQNFFFRKKKQDSQIENHETCETEMRKTRGGGRSSSLHFSTLHYITNRHCIFARAYTCT